MKKYDVILFDADDTLLDFEKASNISIKKIFAQLEYEYSEEMQKRFHSINDALWIVS